MEVSVSASEQRALLVLLFSLSLRVISSEARNIDSDEMTTPVCCLFDQLNTA